MVHKTRGIVFRFVKYGETSIIVTIFTETFGLQSYIVNGIRSKSAKNKIALYQPLTLLNLVVYHRENANIERIKEIQCFHPYTTIPSDIKKSTIALFLAELLNKIVKDESHAKDLFEFISQSFITLDLLEENFENFHLQFMLKLSRYLGFGVQNVNEVLGGRVTSEEIEKILATVLKSDYQTAIKMAADQRRELLDLLLKFYAEHIETLGEMNSVTILREILH
ncbi:DNA repair protein RecO [Chryseosolibacter indicus]|uniref:DNA repair protein RecO n=1 Tax=Chryseosolibacter indicus TaxID=2782351 RepID=A0ABS5VT06_9BACT|nr:DNA repair protein RecO [Chryseosolibacter indicus]